MSVQWLLFKYSNPPPVDIQGFEDVERLQIELIDLMVAGYTEVKVEVPKGGHPYDPAYPNGFRVFKILNPDWVLENSRMKAEENVSAPIAAKVDNQVKEKNSVNIDDLTKLFSKMGGRRRTHRRRRKTQSR